MNGPSPARVLPRPAASTAASRVEKSSLPATTSVIVSVVSAGAADSAPSIASVEDVSSLLHAAATTERDATAASAVISFLLRIG